MKGIEIITKTNGYEAKSIQAMIKNFDKAAAKLFDRCKIRHFYYGDYLDMADILLEDGDYAHFNVTEKRVSFNGHCCTTNEILKKFESMTLNDELFEGKLLELAGTQ